MKKTLIRTGAALLLCGVLATSTFSTKASAAETTKVKVTTETIKTEKYVDMAGIVDALKGTQESKSDEKGTYSEYTFDKVVIRAYEDTHVVWVNGVVESFAIVETGDGTIVPLWSNGAVFEGAKVKLPKAFLERVLNLKFDKNTVSVVAETEKEATSESASEKEAEAATAESNSTKTTENAPATAESTHDLKRP